jgi:ketosteroid isomerase-like protein
MDESEQVVQAARQIAQAIAGRDVEALARWLAPGFVHRTPGGPTRDAASFLDGIRQIPGEIVSVTLASVTVDISGSGALVTGIQLAQVRIDGQTFDDRRGFVDWFVKQADEWRLRAAVDQPELGTAPDGPATG